MKKSNKTTFTLASIFLLFLIVSIVSISVKTNFFSFNYLQSSSDQFFTIHHNNEIQLTLTDLDIETIQFSPKIIDFIASLQDPLYVKTDYGDPSISALERCSTYQMLFFQKCKISGLSRSWKVEGPITFTFFTNAPEGVYGVWGTHKEFMFDGGMSIAGEPVTGGLEFYGYHLGPPSIQFSSVFQNFIALMCMTIFSLLAGIGPALLIKNKKHTRSKMVIIAIFLGIALLILCVLVFSLIKIPFKFLPYAFGLVILINVTIVITFRKKQLRKFNFRAIQQNEIWLLLLLLFSTLICSVQISKIFSPLWIDGMFHHDMIQKIIASNNIFAESVYPIGFHTLAIAQHYLFRDQIVRSLLLTGQWLVTLSGLSFYVFTQQLSTMKMSSLIATLFYLFLSPFPNYLVNWSRYPFLFGLVLLPLGLIFFMDFMQDHSYLWLVVFWMFIVSITHYSAFLLLAAGAIAYTIVYSPSKSITMKAISNPKKVASIIFIFILSGGYILFRLITLVSLDRLTNLLEQTRFISENTDYVYSFGLTLQNFGFLVYLAAIVGCIVLVKQNRKTLIFMWLWSLVAISMIFLQKFIFGASVLTIVNFLFFLSIPVCLLAGMGVACTIEKVSSFLCSLSKKTKYFGPFQFYDKLSIAILLFCLLLTGYRQLAILNPKVVMVIPADVKAFQWIKSNTSSNAKFLINSFEWGYEFKPVDGGGWINAFTHRIVYFYSGNVDRVSLKEFIDDKKVEYVYLGNGLRTISSDWFNDRCLVFKEDNIRIYGVNQKECYQK